MSGLLIHNAIVPVPGLTILGPHDEPWVACPAYAMRTTWVRQWILHKTIADDPERLVGDRGPIGGDMQTIQGWRGGVDGAHLVVGYDGRVCCLADLALLETYHATVSNAWSVGLEMKEQPGGGVFQATLDAAVAVTLAGCRALGIQWQMPRRGTYTGHPIPRMIHGGPDMVGIFGHRDNTERRGHWDPGDLVFTRLAEHGVEEFDFARGEDRTVWTARQRAIGMRPEQCDGIPGPATVAALKAAGYVDGIWALGCSSGPPARPF